jgi:hypothetical protein
MRQSNRPDDSSKQRREALRSSHIRTAATAVVLTFLCWPAGAADRPPVSPDHATPPSTPSSISAVVEIGLPALTRAIERNVPRRLATFSGRRTSCWQRRILGRDVNVGCEYSGYVERVGGIPLRAEHGGISAATPLAGTVSARGTGRFTSRLQGNAKGAMTLYVSARPQLRPDWSVALDMSEGFRWTEEPTLTILGFRINVARYVEPRVRSQLGRVRGIFDRNVKRLDVRAKAERVWQQASTPVQIYDNPPIWLQMKPQSIAFSGITARNNMLQGSVQIAGTTETAIGSQAPASVPTPLPPLSGDVSTPGQFAIVVPVTFGYDLLREKVQDAVASHAQSKGLAVREVTVYPSDGKIVAAVRLGAREGTTVGGDGGDGDWIYLTANPQADDATQTFRLGNLAIGASPTEGSPLAAMSRDPALVQTLQDQVQIAYQKDTEAIMASANARLTRPLADGFRSEGHLTAASVAKVLLLSDAIRLDIRASGDLRILFGL